MNYKTLIISPHCDDEVLGCGGILNNRKGKKFVFYVGVDVFHVLSKEDRRQEVKNVASFLDFDFEIGDFEVNKYQREELINVITDLINKLKPEEIFIPNASSNQDHKEVYDACIVALRPHDKNHFVKNVFVYEVDQYLTWMPNNFEPNYFEPINIDVKIEAYKLHKSQVRSMRPPELLEKFAYVRGISSHTEYAESFKILRMVKSNLDM